MIKTKRHNTGLIRLRFISRTREPGVCGRLASLLSLRSPAILPLATAISAVSTAATILFGPSFIDIQRPAVQVTAVESGNGLFSLAVIAHFHEAKAPGLSSVPVGNDVYSIHCAELLEHGSNGAFGGVEAEVSYKNIFHLIFFLKFAEQRIRAG